MAKRDSYKRVFPIKIHYRDKEMASRDKIQAFHKMAERGFEEIERAIGDIYNTENATGSPLSDQPVYINSLGRAIGSMSDIVPVLSGIDAYSPVLAEKMRDMSYNVIPHPSQTVKLEVGCKFDMTESPNATERTCVKNQTAFYRQIQGTETGICQNTSCPSWSARDGRKINSSICQEDSSTQTFREYKLVVPTEQRTVITPQVIYYSNAGIIYDKYRTDGGASAYGEDRSDPSQSWALATNASISVSGVSEKATYEYPGLNTDATYDMVIEVPAIETDQTVEVNNIPLATIQGTSENPTRYFFNLSAFSSISSIRVDITPSDTDADTVAAVSQIWLIENTPERHRNHGIRLLLPLALDNLTAGTQIPPNFVQLFDTDTNVNRIIDSVRVFSTRFNPKDADLNQNTNRDSFDIQLFGDQKLEVGNDRYLAVTTGAPVASTLGALLEAFVEHVSDQKIHLSRSEVCELLSDRTYCCDDRLKIDLDRTVPSTRIAPTSPSTYQIFTHIYGGFPPYTVTIDWGDGISDANASPIITSGVQVFTITSDVRPPSSPIEFSHTYADGGTYELDFDVTDDPDIFGCSATITNLVSPFNVGNPPVMDSEVRLDYATSYPDFVYQDITAGYNFTLTDADDWTTSPTWHVLSQVHNTDEESGKPDEYYWQFNNSEGLTFAFQYEDISGVQETINFVNSSGTLANNLIQEDSVVVSKGGSIFNQGTDYSVDFVSGIITVNGSTIGANESSVVVSYKHYHNAANLADVPNQWVTLGSDTNASVIDLSTLTTRTDLNTIRFKVKE